MDEDLKPRYSTKRLRQEIERARNNDAQTIAALEAKLAEAKAVLDKIAGSHWERIGYCQTDIDDVPDLTAEEAMLTARRILSALEATPPAPKVTDLLHLLGQHKGWELSWGSIDPFDENGPHAWRVHEQRGNRSDREWHLIGHGDTPKAAITAAQESGQ